MDMFHYCNEEKFKSILSSKKLWLTPVETMNDREEIIHLYRNVWEKVKPILIRNFTDDWAKKIIEIVEDQINKIAMFVDMPFCACFSDDGDLLQQWRSYADDGKGFSICFDSKSLGIKSSLPHPNTILENAIGIGQVIYDFNTQVNIILSIVSQVLNTRQNNALDWVTIMANLKYYSSIFKNHSFYTEQEKRIIYYFNEGHIFNNSFVSGPFVYYEDKRRFELNYYLAERQHSIKKIFLGPKNKLTTEELLIFLSDNGIYLEKENVLKSTSTYR